MSQWQHGFQTKILKISLVLSNSIFSASSVSSFYCCGHWWHSGASIRCVDLHHLDMSSMIPQNQYHGFESRFDLKMFLCLSLLYPFPWISRKWQCMRQAYWSNRDAAICLQAPIRSEIMSTCIYQNFCAHGFIVCNCFCSEAVIYLNTF